MSKKEDLTIDNLLSWDDVIELGSATGRMAVNIGKKHLSDCVKFSSDKYVLEKEFQYNIASVIREDFYELLLSTEKYDIRFRYDKDENGKWHLKYSIPHFIVSMLKNHDILCMEDSYYQELCKKYLTMSKEEIIESAKKILDKQKMGINTLISNYDSRPSSIREYTRNDLLDFRDIIIKRKKSIERIYEYLDRDFPIDKLKSVNKDNYLLFVLSVVFSNPFIQDYINGKINYKQLTSKIYRDELLSIVNCLNNYVLVTDYISDENDKEYEYTMKYSYLKDKKLLSSKDAIRYFNYFIKMVNTEENLKEVEGFYSSYEELLSTKAKETWDKIQNNKLVNSIKLNFDMISSGTKIKLDRVQPIDRVLPRTNSEARRAKLKKDYDLLDEKLDYYGSLNPLFSFLGINNFVGYFAQLYENGVVVLDKYYKISKDRKGNEKQMPASDEAIYIMNYREFAHLSKYSKPELIEEKSYKNPDIDRKYHSKGWTSRVDEVIYGPGYGKVDLDFLKEITDYLGEVEKQKLLTK